MRQLLLSVVMLIVVSPWLPMAVAQEGAYIGLQWDPLTEREFLVRLDPYTNSVWPIRHIPHVRYIHGGYAFNPEKGHYVFTGSDTTRVGHHFVVDAQTGELLSRIPMGHQINGMAYDPDGDRYLGVWRDNLNSVWYLVSFDPFTAAMTLIDSIPGLHGVNSSTPLVRNGQYVLCATADNMSTNLYVIDVVTGAILSATPMDPRMTAPEYDATSDLYSTMFYDTVASAFQLVWTDPLTATIHLIAHLPEFRGIQGGTTPAEPGRYVFAGSDHDGVYYRVVLDLHTGEVLSKVPFDPLAPWLNHLVYHARHLPADSPTENSLTIFPNPTSDFASIAVPAWGSQRESLRMFDAGGRLVMEWSGITSPTMRVDVSGLSSGLYMLRFVDATGGTAHGKLVVE